MRQSAATKAPLLVSTSGLISSERASTLRAAANNFRIDSFSCFASFAESPHDATASSTAEFNGPRFTSHGILRVAAARSSIPVPPPAAKMIIGPRAASSMANERKNSRSISIFSSTSTASTGNCPTFIDNIRSACARASSGFLAKTTPPIPARPVVQAWIFTTTSPPNSFVAVTASSAVDAARPRGTLNPVAARIALP